jgi:hypothetical protein
MHPQCDDATHVFLSLHSMYISVNSMRIHYHSIAYGKIESDHVGLGFQLCVYNLAIATTITIAIIIAIAIAIAITIV